MMDADEMAGFVPPSPFRMRYRAALAEAVRAVVMQKLDPTSSSIEACTPDTIQAEHRPAFVALVMAEFASLHSGNAIRFGIDASEFRLWERRRET